MDFDVEVTEFPDDDLEWEEIPLANFDAFRQQRNLPILNVDTVKAFNNLSLGTYRYHHCSLQLFSKLFDILYLLSVGREDSST